MTFERLIYWMSQIIKIVAIYRLLGHFKSLPRAFQFLTFLLMAMVGFQLWNIISNMMGSFNPMIYKLALPTY